MNKLSKVIYISHSGDLQGAGIALVNIITGIISSGKYIPIVIMPHEGQLSKVLNQIGVKYYVIPYYNETLPFIEFSRQYINYIPKIIRCLLFNFLAKKKLIEIVKKECPAIIHTNTGVIHIGYRVAKKLKVPHIWHLREIQGKSTRYYPLFGLKKFKEELEDKNFCISISKAVKNFYDIDTPNEVVYDGVFSSQTFKEPTLSKQAQSYFLYVGGLQKSKGFYDAIEAFKIVAKDNDSCELWLAGIDNVDFNKVICSNPYKNRIKYLGIRHDIMQLMANSKAVLVLGYDEGFGFTLVESVLSKTIAIARNQAGLKEQMDNAKIALGIDIALRINNNLELANSMKAVLSEDYKLADREIAFQYVYENYSLENSSCRLVNIYKRVLTYAYT